MPMSMGPLGQDEVGGVGDDEARLRRVWAWPSALIISRENERDKGEWRTEQVHAEDYRVTNSSRPESPERKAEICGMQKKA